MSRNETELEKVVELGIIPFLTLIKMQNGAIP